MAGDGFAWLLLLNPADVFRIFNVFSLDQVGGLFGLGQLVPPAFGNSLLMGGVLLGWITLPLGLAVWRFKP